MQLTSTSYNTWTTRSTYSTWTTYKTVVQVLRQVQAHHKLVQVDKVRNIPAKCFCFAWDQDIQKHQFGASISAQQRLQVFTCFWMYNDCINLWMYNDCINLCMYHIWLSVYDQTGSVIGIKVTRQSLILVISVSKRYYLLSSYNACSFGSFMMSEGKN